jgi:hypothetical protein
MWKNTADWGQATDENMTRLMRCACWLTKATDTHLEYANAPYCHLLPAPLYNVFPHYLIKGTIFLKKLLNTKCVF